jgi:hypothetical protein
MSGHTKGRWSASYDCNGLGYVGVGPNFTIANILLTPDGNQEANARLISSAPTMYEFVASKAASGDTEAIAIMGKINGNA